MFTVFRHFALVSCAVHHHTTVRRVQDLITQLTK